MNWRPALAAAALWSLVAALPALAQAEDTLSNQEIVGRVGDAVFNRHDFSVLDAYMKADYIQHNPLVPQGRAGFRRFFEATFEGVPDWSYALKHIIAEGDFVWAHGTYSGTQSGEWLGIPATGRAFAIDAVDIFRLENGKLTEHWDVMDIYGLFKQLGVIARRGEAAARRFPATARQKPVDAGRWATVTSLRNNYALTNH